MKKNIERDAQYAARLYADATRERLAEIYATALLGAIETLGVSSRDLWESYDSFIELCDANPKFEEILASAMVPVEEKLRIISEISGGARDVFLDFLKTLARRGRFELLRDIRLPLRRLDDARRGRIAVKITTAAPLDEKTRQILSSRLRDLVGGEPRFSVEIDPEMIGGIVVRVGDVVYDASIATQLELARREMIDRSAHEIQSRRDSFRYPEGN